MTFSIPWQTRWSPSSITARVVAGPSQTRLTRRPGLDAAVQLLATEPVAAFFGGSGLGLYLALTRTRAGTAVRAVAVNPADEMIGRVRKI